VHAGTLAFSDQLNRPDGSPQRSPVARGRTDSLIPPSCVDLCRAPNRRRPPSGARSPGPVNAGLPSQTWQDSSGFASRSGHGTRPALDLAAMPVAASSARAVPPTQRKPLHRIRGLSQIHRPWTPGLSCRARWHDDASSRLEPPEMAADDEPESFGRQPTHLDHLRSDRDTVSWEHERDSMH
jgi:hypothetical protein